MIREMVGMVGMEVESIMKGIKENYYIGNQIWFLSMIL